MVNTHTLETAEADLAYDVHGPLPTADGRPPLFMIGQPMDASGFATLASYFPDRTVVTYDPRGLGRSIRNDDRVDHVPTLQAADVHAVIQALGVGPVDMFASSGGAVTALALVAAYPDDVTTLVAHEPPLIPVLPDAPAAERARAAVRDVYEANGSNAGMAAFIAMTSWRGEFTDDYFNQPPPDPSQFGMPSDDDGSRDDPLLSDWSWPVSSYQPDVAALAVAPTRIVIAVGEESTDLFTGRTAAATAELLGQQPSVFPSHHGGFLGDESGYAGQPEAFADRLRQVFDSADLTRTDTASRVISAPVERVFSALVDSDALTAWLPPEGMSGRLERFDPRPGGSYRMILTYADSAAAPGKAAADSDIVEARFVEITPGVRVVQAVDFASDDPAYAGTMTMTWEVSTAAGGTRVEIRAEDVPAGISAEDHAAGLASSLANLAAYVER